MSSLAEDSNSNADASSASTAGSRRTNSRNARTIRIINVIHRKSALAAVEYIAMIKLAGTAIAARTTIGPLSSKATVEASHMRDTARNIISESR